MMSDWRVPDGYIIVPVAAGTLVARAASLEAARTMVERDGSLHAFASRHGTRLPGRGRGTAHRVAVDGGAWAIRHYRRGGAMARWLGDRYLRIGTPRPLRELHASATARERGVRTPRVEAAFLSPSACSYRADIATSYVGGSRDLATLAFDARAGSAARIAAWRAAGQLLAVVFASGLTHRDLNLGNVLIVAGDAAVVAHLIDLDRATIAATPDARRAARMLARLHRSRRKLERLAGRRVDLAELAAFDDALHGAAEM
jgi:3-deoxy-D-manno-octulosonic acid kinase